jgi:hypothetical protein
MRCDVPDELVLNALRKAIERDTGVRLVAIGETPEEAGLFPDRKGPAKKAIQACIEVEKPLLLIREEPSKGKTPNQVAEITDTGLATLAAQTPIKEFPDLIAASASLMKTRVIRSCLRSLAGRSAELDPWNYRAVVETCLTLAQGQFDAIEKRLAEVQMEEKRLGNTIRKFLKDRWTGVEIRIKRLTDERDALSEASTAVVDPAEVVASSQARRPQLPEWQRVPSTDPEIDFQRSLGAELVFAWQDAASSETRDGLERALFNVGIERLNEPGEIVEFDSTSHHTEDEVVEGESVEVVLPGWKLVNTRGTSLLAKGRVAKWLGSPSAKEAAEPATPHPDGDVVAERGTSDLQDGKPLESQPQASSHPSRPSTVVAAEGSPVPHSS